MASDSKKILVTGASGLLGRELCRQLSKRKHYVVGVDDESRFPNYSCAEVNEYHNVDLRDFLQKTNDFELIFHYAAVNGTKNFYQFPTRTLMNNASADLAMYEFASSNQDSKLIYASSSEVVSGSRIYPTPEEVDIAITDVHNRRWSYMIPKILMENLLVNGTANYLILRYFNVFSEHTGRGHFVRDVLDKIKEQNYELIGGDETRSFCYVEDAIAASIDLAEICDREVINVGSDEEIDIATAANIIADKLGLSIEWTFKPGLPGSTKRRVPDLSRLRKHIPGYNPRSFSEALAQMLKV